MNETLHASHRLEVHDVHVHYGKVCALHGVSFDVPCGSALALIGPNGSGKSTLLKTIAGLITNSAGTITWCGEPVSVGSTDLAYLPQLEEIDWDFPLTVRGLVEMGRYPALGPWGKFKKEDEEIVDKSLEAMDILSLQDRHIRALSGGQQQRAFIARALAQEPHILLLDEPFNGLDKTTREILIRLLKNLARTGHLVVASHHDIHTAHEIFDYALLLKTKPVAFGKIEDVLVESELMKAFT